MATWFLGVSLYALTTASLTASLPGRPQSVRLAPVSAAVIPALLAPPEAVPPEEVAPEATPALLVPPEAPPLLPLEEPLLQAASASMPTAATATAAVRGLLD